MIEIKVPELAESVKEATIAEWLKKEGESVQKGENLVELETDKVNIEISAEESGILSETLCDEGDTVFVGDVIAKMNVDEETSSKKFENNKKDKAKDDLSSDFSHEHEEKKNFEKDIDKARPIASPAARKYAREKGIELNEITPKDPLGRVRKDDLKELENEKDNDEISNDKEEATSKKIERVRMSRRRQTIAKRLVEAQQNSAMLTTFNEVDMTKLLKLRDRKKDDFYEENGVKLGFMSFFTKAVIGALKKYPYVNAEIEENEILLKKFYDIGIAVSTEEGLVVPVVRDADHLDFAGIEKEVNSLAEKAHEKKLDINDLTGGTFTITNGGVFGSLWSTPILNTPQVGILGMHKIQMRPVAIDEERFENRPMMYIALSYDHRIIDGKDAVGFLVKVKELIEDPESLLLQG
ncbi:2-oxoglutarate dehydrogenase complex dihydrolipoyllysine-residue succinyltransferase [Evansella cellulosilytica]|uniref:Dihydrolipoyllysine-residue succinyltransferase component of 2-oxoglutarate dehydrogenase complex n=1 Tax=Evansella cellulosilytica (strain ATCC 21833 / DSM 2522 / FERM P-1141 / JCM 9156 / N-4) TaxID=649639 RepID=E6U0A5_EVAC2|nr:2-oxoglutarate dehydrogenase complex dihydrolipoyllysine-residue succinyltransferase [Evansella cellulosilytica]ADU30221.1 2-oxoglutarate dehydrogenase, E2 subunit, dihydrolipoamide succinyltransferase [Evansella cellulosilytica DSM 2522]